jgi:voltage-gated potassium channel
VTSPPATSTRQPGDPRPGDPRSAGDAATLADYERRIRLPIILSAILPILVVPQVGHPVSVAIGIATWGVFLLDYVVHARHLHRYGQTQLGRFDLAIVILTAPWFLLPGAEAGGIVVVLRLARLARLVVASRAASILVARLGRVGIVAGSILGVCALVAFVSERPVNEEFATFGDALWWATVTLTTVGYGDIVPTTPGGRTAAAALMVTGVAVLGMLAGTLASFLGLQDDETGPATPAEQDQPAASPDTDARMDQLIAEVQALRVTVERLEADRR